MQAESPPRRRPRRRSAAPSCPSSRIRAERAPGPAARAQPPVVGRARPDPRRQRVLRRRRASEAGADTLRPFELEEVGDVDGQAPRPPAVPFRPRLALLGASRRLGRRRSTSPRPRSRRHTASPTKLGARRPLRRRPTSTRPSRRSAASASTSSTPASGRSTGFPTCPAGRRSSPRCSTPGGFLYLSEFHPFTWVFADEELDRRARLLPRPRGRALRRRRAGQLRRPRRPRPATTPPVEWAHTLAEVVARGARRRPAARAALTSTTTPCSRACPHLSRGPRDAQRRRRLPPARGPAPPAADVLAARQPRRKRRARQRSPHCAANRTTQSVIAVNSDRLRCGGDQAERGFDDLRLVGDLGVREAKGCEPGRGVSAGRASRQRPGGRPSGDSEGCRPRPRARARARRSRLGSRSPTAGSAAG